MNVSGEIFNYTYSGTLQIPANNSDIPTYNILLAKDE